MSSFWTWLISWLADLWFIKPKAEGKSVNVTVSQSVDKPVLIGGVVDDNRVKYTEFLEGACKDKSTCRIVGLARGELAKGKLTSLDHNRIEIELVPGNGNTLSLTSFRLLSAYLVSFFYQGKQMMFSGLAINMDSQKLLLEMTSDITTGNVRRDFRVAVRKDDGLSVKLALGSKLVYPIPVDISFSGIMIEVQPGMELSLDQIISVTISLSGYTAQLNGEVRRKDGNKYGIFFSETPFSSSKDAISLRKIVKTVESYRLSQNRRNDLD